MFNWNVLRIECRMMLLTFSEQMVNPSGDNHHLLCIVERKNLNEFFSYTCQMQVKFVLLGYENVIIVRIL